MQTYPNIICNSSLYVFNVSVCFDLLSLAQRRWTCFFIQRRELHALTLRSFTDFICTNTIHNGFGKNNQQVIPVAFANNQLISFFFCFLFKRHQFTFISFAMPYVQFLYLYLCTGITNKPLKSSHWLCFVVVIVFQTKLQSSHSDQRYECQHCRYEAAALQ